MKVRYATAFLNVYRDSIAKIHKDVTKRRGRMERNGNAELRLAMVAMSGKKDALSHVLIAQAYNAVCGKPYETAFRTRSRSGDRA